LFYSHLLIIKLVLSHLYLG